MMKTIATINFKGGVGKTTSTWAMGHVAAQSPQHSSLVFDLDAQMSLTQSIALNEDGNPFKSFTDWYERAVAKKKTIFDALDEFTKTTAISISESTMILFTGSMRAIILFPL
jgi:cellulose biosynthesis protein BcsQ